MEVHLHRLLHVRPGQPPGHAGPPQAAPEGARGETPGGLPEHRSAAARRVAGVHRPLIRRRPYRESRPRMITGGRAASGSS
ncbi:hypothetical protein ACFFX0_16245 [Citricoccus parietis]|uniref:Uncharacterized protein n=1 Tax=Citricoccus parietis TaxID=592307 RepID=A0ABV5G153_9MICC